MITNYLLIQANDRFLLVDMVNSYIEIGWQPLGGISVVDIPMVLYTQAVVQIERKREGSDDQAVDSE